MKFFWFDRRIGMGSVYESDGSEAGCIWAIIGGMAALMIFAVVLSAPLYIPAEGKEYICKFINANAPLLTTVFGICLLLKLFVRKLEKNALLKVIISAYVFVFVVYVLLFKMGFDAVPLAVRSMVEENAPVTQTESVKKVIEILDRALIFLRNMFQSVDKKFLGAVDKDAMGYYLVEMQILPFLAELGKFLIYIVVLLLGVMLPAILGAIFVALICFLPYILGIVAIVYVDKAFQKIYSIREVKNHDYEEEEK